MNKKIIGSFITVFVIMLFCIGYLYSENQKLSKRVTLIEDTRGVSLSRPIILTDYDTPSDMKERFQDLKNFYEEKDGVYVEMIDIHNDNVAVQFRNATREIFEQKDESAFYDAMLKFKIKTITVTGG